MQQKPEFIIDGFSFSDREGFAAQFTELVLTNFKWNGNYDAFNDILRGGCGTPDGGFVLRWKNSNESLKRLGADVFNSLVEILKDHGPSGSKPEDEVILLLE